MTAEEKGVNKNSSRGRSCTLIPDCLLSVRGGYTACTENKNLHGFIKIWLNVYVFFH